MNIKTKNKLQKKIDEFEIKTKEFIVYIDFKIWMEKKLKNKELKPNYKIIIVYEEQ